jgi:hypothetical protein
MTLAVALLGIGLIPSSADAGILQRLFGRNRNNGRYVVRPVPAETDAYRRYSYEPSDGAVITTRPSRTAAPAPWNLPKSDPRRYD